MDWLDLLAVQGTLKSLLQHHSSNASILQCSAFFTVQFSHPYMTTGKTIAWLQVQKKFAVSWRFFSLWFLSLGSVYEKEAGATRRVLRKELVVRMHPLEMKFCIFKLCNQGPFWTSQEWVDDWHQENKHSSWCFTVLFGRKKNEDTWKFIVVVRCSFIHSISIHRLVMKNDYLSVGIM